MSREIDTKRIKKKIQRCESILWLVTKVVLYFLMLAVFMIALSQENHSLRALSRSLGITLSTFSIVGFLFLQVYGRFDIGRRKSKPIIYSLSLATLCTDIITYLQLMIMRTNIQDIYAFRLHGLGWLVLAFVVQLIIIVVFAYAANGLFFKIHPPERCCVITSSQDSLNKVAKVIDKFKKQYKIVKVLDYRKQNILSELVDVDTVFIYDVPSAGRAHIISYCYKKKINIYFNPEVEDVVEMNAEYYVLDDLSLVNANVKSLTMEQRIIKRLMDIILSLLLGILSAPLWIGGAIAVKLGDGGPIFFKQKRATIHGRVFEVYKLRTMKVNVENRSAEAGDSRITKAGAFLRKTRIDELPQLINVLKGDMSFVGPRPEMLENVHAYTKDVPEFQYRLRVKAGLTGHAQISGKYNTTPKDKLIMDMMYIENFNIWKDIQLILQTVIVLLKSDSTEGFMGQGESKYVFKEEDNKNS